MVDKENPFASKSELPTQDGLGFNKSVITAWIVAVIAIMIALLFFLIWTRSQSGKAREISGLKARCDELTASLSRALAENQTNLDLTTALKNQLADLQKERDMAGQMAKNLETEMRTALESKDVTISKLQGKLTVTILDRVMFDSGDAVIKPGGEPVMQKIAGFLAAHPEFKIHVIGHTDNIPIRPGGRFASNWELSAARALAAVHWLTEKAGVDPRRVGAVGYGEFRPIADNSTPEGRAKNRRIAITILPDELAGVDAVPTVPAGISVGNLPAN